MMMVKPLYSYELNKNHSLNLLIVHRFYTSVPEEVNDLNQIVDQDPNPYITYNPTYKICLHTHPDANVHPLDQQKKTDQLNHHP